MKQLESELKYLIDRKRLRLAKELSAARPRAAHAGKFRRPA